VDPGCPVLVRYADDLAVLCASRAQAEQVKARLAGWLEPRGLAFNEAKTKIVHLSEGFDFLGFNIRRYPNGKLLTKPGKDAMRQIRKRLSAEMKALRGANADAVITRLNPVITGWAAYYRIGCPSAPSPHWTPTCGSWPGMGQVLPPKQAETLGRHPVLRHVQPGQAGQVGLRKPPEERLLSPQVRLDQDRPAPHGRRAGISR